jgi:hypothetical protein
LKTVETRDIRTWLEAQGQKVLLDILMAQVAADGRLRQELVLRIAKENAGGIDLATYRTAIDNACSIDGYLDYGEVYEYSEEVSEVVDSIERLFQEGFGGETIKLCEYALEQLGDAMEHVDDSDGYLGGEVERLLELHLNACKQNPPDPDELAERLLRYELAWGGYDLFYSAVNTYQDVLGTQGIAEYRRLVEQKWQAIPVKTPGGKNIGHDSNHYAITRIMESLAKAEGDVDAMIAIKKRDLSASWNYLAIADIYLEC